MDWTFKSQSSDLCTTTSENVHHGGDLRIFIHVMLQGSYIFFAENHIMGLCAKGYLYVKFGSWSKQPAPSNKLPHGCMGFFSNFAAKTREKYKPSSEADPILTTR